MPSSRAARLVLAALALLPATDAAGAQLLPDAALFLPENAEPHPYVVRPPHVPDHWPKDGAGQPAATGHCQQRYRLYLPKPPHERPASGWPVLVHVSLSGFDKSELTGFVDPFEKRAPQRLAAFLAEGWAVIVATATTSVGQACGEALPGGGLFHPPGVSLAELGGDGELVPYDRFDHPMAEKDAVLLVQHVRHHAGERGHLLAALDRQRVVITGHSAGAMALMWAALGPERRAQPPFDPAWGGAFVESSRPDAALLLEGAVWWPIFHPSQTFAASHFGALGQPLVPCETLGPGKGTLPAHPLELQEASALHYERWRGVPLHMVYGEPSVCLDPSPDWACAAWPGAVPAWPSCFTGGGHEGLGTPKGLGLHPAWSGYAWKHRHPESVRLLVTSAAAAAQATEVQPDIVRLLPPVVPAAAFHDDPASRALDLYEPGTVEFGVNEDALHWLSVTLGTPPPRWSAIETPRPGVLPPHVAVPGVPFPGAPGSVQTYRPPQLVGLGTAAPGSLVTLVLGHALPGAAVELYWSPVRDDTPFRGGVLVPGNPQLVRGTVDPEGRWQVALPVPAAVPGGRLYFQAWVEDGKALQGWAGSNAVSCRVL